MSERYTVEPVILWTAVCASCEGDIFRHIHSEHVAYADRETVGEIIGNWEIGYVLCPHCASPLTDAEAESIAERMAEERQDGTTA